MNVSVLLVCLIAVDVLLCAAVIFLLFHNAFPKTKSVLPEGITDTDLQQLQEMLSRSQEDSQAFQNAISEGQSSLEELIRRIDERERALRTLLEEVHQEVNQRLVQGTTQDGAGGMKEERQYKDAALLIRQGKTDQEIIRECNITEGELALIKGLLGIRNESA